MTTKREIATQYLTAVQGCEPASKSVDHYVRKYSKPELETLLEASGYADAHSRQARYLYDAASWSQYSRVNHGDRPLTPGMTSPVLKTALTRTDADAWYAAHFTPETTAPEPETAAPEPETAIKVYLVVVQTVKGLMDVELIATSGERAASRARWTLIHARRYGDIDQVQWLSVEEVVCRYFATCVRTASRFVETPHARVPACQSCYEFCGRQGMKTEGHAPGCNDVSTHEGECNV